MSRGVVVCRFFLLHPPHLAIGANKPKRVSLCVGVYVCVCVCVVAVAYIDFMQPPPAHKTPVPTPFPTPCSPRRVSTHIHTYVDAQICVGTTVVEYLSGLHTLIHTHTLERARACDIENTREHRC